MRICKKVNICAPYDIVNRMQEINPPFDWYKVSTIQILKCGENFQNDFMLIIDLDGDRTLEGKQMIDKIKFASGVDGVKHALDDLKDAIK